jgi:cytidylate kinase
MRKWALRLESQGEYAQPPAVESPRQLIHPYIAVSRETGVDAAGIGQAVATRLGWKVLDSELLDYIAEHYGMSRLALEYVDERAATWFHETFGKWLDEQLVSQAEYVSRLGTTMLLAAQHESTVFVGRGAQFVLPREAGYAIRLIAPRKQRIQRIIAARHCGQQEAESFVDESDRGRAEFVRRYFQRDVADPHNYDLVINLDRTPREAAAELICSGYTQSFCASRDDAREASA